ncbi:AAA family ATPase [Phytohabitans flavus]|uniref:AAA family ATPase n=1 Tax=Phytohabitans flavus TaxID=1076124 RepID=UPI0015634481|nr:AAA family ATPase [Phytohabitans flavus]
MLLDTFRTEREIHLSDLATQLDRVLGQGTVYSRALGFASLVRSRPPVAGQMFAPMDIERHLEEVLTSLSADERWHFLSKARGAEHGELSWFFQGRQDEMDALVDWLEGTESGLLVVTGKAGSGKSALLGNLFTHSVPELRAALTRRGLLASGASRIPRPTYSMLSSTSAVSTSGRSPAASHQPWTWATCLLPMTLRPA